jgi:HD-GYP domain-containing protein (c-di-GMP phosphodiesterase class II)
MKNFGTQEIIISILFWGGIIIWYFLSKNKKKQSIGEIIDNDPVLNQLDKDIEAINKKATDRLKDTDPDFIELLEKNGFNPLNLNKDDLSEKNKNKINEQKNEKLKKIEEYLKLGYINKNQKQDYIGDFIENKKIHIFPEHNYISTENMSETDDERWGYLLAKLDKLLENDKRRFKLSSKYGKDIAQRLINKEVWLNMSDIELKESRGYPNDKEKELTTEGETEIFIYGNKKTGSYFTLQNGKVIKIKDRQK